MYIVTFKNLRDSHWILSFLKLKPTSFYEFMLKTFLSGAECEIGAATMTFSTYVLSCKTSPSDTTFPTLLPLELHVHKHHEAPAKPPHQKHGDLHAVDDQVIEQPKVQAPVPQQKQDHRQLVLQPQEHAHADVLQEEEGREGHPEQRGQQAAAEVQQETEEAVHAAWAQVQVKVIVLGAH